MTDLLLTENYVVINPIGELNLVTAEVASVVSDPTIHLVEIETNPNVVTIQSDTSYAIVQQNQLIVIGDNGTGGGIGDAPHNNHLFVRKNGVWIELNHTSFPSEQDSYLYAQVDLLNAFRVVAIGNGPDPDAGFVTFHDLVDRGVLGGNGITPHAVYMATPPAPTGFRAENGVTKIDLYWDSPVTVYINHGHTEVYRSEYNDLNTATKILDINNLTGGVDTTALVEVGYFYWVKFISIAGVPGPFNNVNGTYAIMSIAANAGNLLDLLNEQITASQLNEDLRAPIDLILAPDGLVYQQEVLAAGLINEATVRNAALANEAAIRTAAINDEIANREDGYESLHTEFTTETESLKSQIDFITSKTNSTFDTSNLWQFDTTDESWVTSGGSTTVSGGRLRPAFSSDTYVTSPDVVVDGAMFQEVRVKIRRVGTPTWDGTLRFITTLAPSYSSSLSHAISEPVFFQNEATVAWDLSTQTDWTTRIITGIRLQLSVVSDASNYYELDWVGIGRTAPGASIAYVKQESLARTTAIDAEAALRETLATQMRGSYTGTDIDSITTGLLYNERVARVTADTAFSSQLALISAGTDNQFDHANIWYFDSTIESWTGYPSAPTLANPGWLRPADHATDPRVMSPTGLALDAVKYPQVRVRVRRHGTPTWAGELFWRKITDGPFASPQVMNEAEPTWDANGIGLLTYSPDWSALVTIDQIRLDLTTVQSSSNWIEIDWIALGRPSPGASAAELAAELLARTTADTALASSITSLTTTVGGKASQTSVDSLASRTTTAEDTLVAQGTKITQIDSQLYPSVINPNPPLIITSGVIPDGWSAWDSTGLSKYTGTYAYTGGNALQMVCTTGSNAGIMYTGNNYKSYNAQFLDVEIVFTVTSGTSLSGAGLLLDWNATGPVGYRTSIPFKDIFPTFALGSKLVCKFRLQRPVGFTGTFFGYTMWLMGNYPNDGLGAITNHTIIYDNVKVFSSDVSASAIQILDSRVTSAEGVNTTQASQIVTLTADVGSKASAAALTTLDARVTAAEGVNTSQSTSLTSLSNSLASNINVLDTSLWVPGTTGAQGSGNSAWASNGTASQNSIVTAGTSGVPYGPFNNVEMMWQGASDGSNGPNGGFQTRAYPQAKLLKSRGAVFSFFFRWNGLANGASPGTFYTGYDYTDIVTLAGVVDSNPYAAIIGYSSLTANNWYLFYGVIHPYGSNSPDTGLSGIYDISTGTRIYVGAEFRMGAGWDSSPQYFRSYNYYSTSTNTKVWWDRPNVVPLDVAQTPWDLMRQDQRLPATAAAVTALTSEVHDGATGLVAIASRLGNLEVSVPAAGGNLIPNDTLFSDGNTLSGWIASSSGAAYSTGRNLAGSGWTPLGLNQIGLTASGSPGGYFWLKLSNVPVIPGKRYCFSTYTAAHRAVTYIYIEWYDSTGSLISTSALVGSAVSSGGNDLSNWARPAVFSTAPTGGLTALIAIRMNVAPADSNPYFWICKPMMEEATATQTSPSPWKASDGGATARVALEEIARATADSAIATNVTNVTTTVNGHTSTIAVQQSSINGLTAQYMVKLDVNGYISGFGLYNTGATSDFFILASKFAVMSPGSAGISPFVVDTVNNRVAMNGAFIKTATIDNAAIGNLNVNKLVGVSSSWMLANIGVANITDAYIQNLNASKIIAKTITTDKLVLNAASVGSSFSITPVSFGFISPNYNAVELTLYPIIVNKTTVGSSLRFSCSFALSLYINPNIAAGSRMLVYDLGKTYPVYFDDGSGTLVGNCVGGCKVFKTNYTVMVPQTSPGQLLEENLTITGVLPASNYTGTARLVVKLKMYVVLPGGSPGVVFNAFLSHTVGCETEVQENKI